MVKTGFGRVAKTILAYLYNTNKYEIIHYCCGVQKSNPELNKTPWRSIGSLPDGQLEIEKIVNDPQKTKLASYGNLYLDEIIKKEKPDIYIGVQDIWGLDFAIKSEWFSKINSIIWTTLDSLPILPDAIEYAKKIENYWVWSSFATKELNKLGYKQAITINGPIQTQSFFRLSQEKRLELRKKFNIDIEKFIIGFVFRNQLRKSLPNLFAGYSLWKKQNPTIKNTSLLLHTSWKEGWNISKLAKEYGIPDEEILTTYICSKCKNYIIKPFSGEKIKCDECKTNDGLNTTSVNLGVAEEQLNEIYNLMDLYCHPFTSGGQEIPIQEAKLTELIALVTNYSCGEEMCEDIKGTLPLDWHEYREHGTEFKKASTDEKSIAKNINKIYSMPIKQKIELEKYSREWTINKFSIEKIGKKIEKILDDFPDKKYDFKFKLKTEQSEMAEEERLFDNSRRKNLIIFDINNDIDMLYASAIPNKIKNMYPNADIYIVVDQKYIDFFVHNTFVTKIIFKKSIYSNINFLDSLKSKYFIDNLILLDEYSSGANKLLKLNKTNIEINI